MRRAFAAALVAAMVLGAVWARAAGDRADVAELAACRDQLGRIATAVRRDIAREEPGEQVYLLEDVEHSSRLAAQLVHNLLDIYTAAGSVEGWGSFKKDKLAEFKKKAGFAIKELGRRKACLESGRPLAGDAGVEAWLDKTCETLGRAVSILKDMVRKPPRAEAGKQGS